MIENIRKEEITKILRRENEDTLNIDTYTKRKKKNDILLIVSIFMIPFFIFHHMPYTKHFVTLLFIQDYHHILYNG